VEIAATGSTFAAKISPKMCCGLAAPEELTTLPQIPKPTGEETFPSSPLLDSR